MNAQASGGTAASSFSTTAATPAVPIAIDGINMPPVPPVGSPPSTPGTVSPGLTTDGKNFDSTVLYQQGDVTITRNVVAGGGQFQDTVVIKTGNADDDIQVTRGTSTVTGTELLNVTINGQPFQITLNDTLPGQPRQNLGIDSGDGNDRIIAAADVRTHMDVKGGAGDDTIATGRGRDRVDGGAGNDSIQTGAGRDDVFGNSGDDVIDAGEGNDVVYGGDGNDTLSGYEGRDYLEGGRGNDTLDGGNDQDVLSGGQGDDILRSGRGNDRVYTGAGADTVDNPSGKDVVYGQAAEDSQVPGRGAKNRNIEVGMTDAPGAQPLGHSITITGTPEFVQRVEADIDLLRSSPDGRRMLAALDQAAAAPPAGKGHHVDITELQNQIGASAALPPLPGSNQLHWDPSLTELRTDSTGTVVPAAGSNAEVRYNPSFHSDFASAPSTVLFHELSHAYGIVTGTMQPGQMASGNDKNIANFERQAVGLNNQGLRYDFDGNPSTRPTRGYPEYLTENGLREEMGLSKRDRYSLGDSDLVGPGTTSMRPLPPGAKDPHVAAMLSAMESNDPQALRVAMRALAGSEDGAVFRAQGVKELSEQIQRRSETSVMPQHQDAQTEQSLAQSGGGMRR
jgi:Ca2+-binding RTX toxin-like protein